MTYETYPNTITTSGSICGRQSVLTGFAFELALAVAHASAAHHVTVLSAAIPLLTDSVVITVVVTPLCRTAEE